MLIQQLSKISASPPVGIFRYSGGDTNRIFDPSANLDGLHHPWIALRDGFRDAGCDLVSDDEERAACADFEIHLNVQPRIGPRPAFVILSECGLIHPPNVDRERLKRYRKVFTWNPELVEAGLATKIQLAHPLGVGRVDGYAKRPRLVVLIAANKALPSWRPKSDLYRERVRAIRWFEHHAPEEFALYGHGWDKSPRLPTRLGGAIHRFEALLPWRPRWFPSWRGALATKRAVLETARFSIVYENVRGLRGYITEKIFDAFCAGNVPVYWGAEDITSYVPADCFIDRRNFSSYAALYQYLRTMPEEKYLDYQRAIVDFLVSDAAQVFSIPCFVGTIVPEVLACLGKAR